MNCKKCGADNDESAKYCGKCGQFLQQELAETRAIAIPNSRKVIIFSALGVLIFIALIAGWKWISYIQPVEKLESNIGSVERLNLDGRWDCSKLVQLTFEVDETFEKRLSGLGGYIYSRGKYSINGKELELKFYESESPNLEGGTTKEADSMIWRFTILKSSASSLELDQIFNSTSPGNKDYLSTYSCQKS